MCKLVANPSRTRYKPNELIDINGANSGSVHTGFVHCQVPLQLHRRLHLHVVLEEAAAERGLVVISIISIILQLFQLFQVQMNIIHIFLNEYY